MMSSASAGPAGEDPRVVRTRTTVLDAATELLAERGFSGFSIDALVARTGVSKTTIYRHWPSRSDLLAATVATFADRRVVPDTGSLRGDLVAFMQERARKLADERWARSLPGLLEAAHRDPALFELVAKLMAQTRSQLLTMLDRAEGRGEMQGGLDHQLVASLLIGPFFLQRLVAQQAPTEAEAEAIVDMVLAGIAAP